LSIAGRRITSFFSDTSICFTAFMDRTIPEAVASELRAAGSPPAVSSWIAHPPEWVVVTPVPREQIESITGDLDPGERAAIALAGTIEPTSF
jgi:predicted nucleic acid-binding protein